MIVQRKRPQSPYLPFVAVTLREPAANTTLRTPFPKNEQGLAHRSRSIVALLEQPVCKASQSYPRRCDCRLAQLPARQFFHQAYSLDAPTRRCFPID